MARNVLAVAVFIASLPLAFQAMRIGFGISATMVVPTCCLGFCLSVSSPQRAARIGWFVFASVVTFLLPMMPWLGGLIHSSLHWIDDIVPHWAPTLYDVVEMGGMLAESVLPWLGSILLGWCAAKAARRVFDSTDESDGCHHAAARFTLRGMMMGMVICCGLTAWLSNTVRQWQNEEQTQQSFFLDQFKQTFTSGRVVFRNEPTIFGIVENMQSHVKQYRVSAPIVKDGDEKWAVWTYWTDANSGCVLNFDYAEAPTEDALPPILFPKYLNEPTNVLALTDGEPKNTTTADLVEAPKFARRGSTIKFIAKTDRGKECELEIEPFFARSDVPVIKLAPESGVVDFDVALDPKFKGTKIDYKIICRTNSLYRAKYLDGSITLTDPGDEQKNAPESRSGAF